MNAEIIAVGSEMLTPQRVDTNSLNLTEELNNLGVEVVLKAVSGDDLERVAAIAPTNQSPSSNLLVRYHLSVRREVEKRVEQKFLKSRPSAETGS